MSDLLTVRYPSGNIEFRMSDSAPKVGDVLERNADNWIVETVAEIDGRTEVRLRAGLRSTVEEPDAQGVIEGT